MSARRFTLAWLFVFAALFLVALLFPFILKPILVASDCRKIGGACGAMALVLGIYIRLPIVILGGIVLVVLAQRRARRLGVSPWAPMFVGLTYITIAPQLFAFGNFWAASFSLGMGTRGAPLVIPVPLLAMLTALSLLPDGAGRDPRRLWPRRVAYICGAMLLPMSLPLVLQTLSMLPFGYGLRQAAYSPLVSAVPMALHALGGNTLSSMVFYGFLLALGWWVWSARRSSESPAQS